MGVRRDIQVPVQRYMKVKMKSDQKHFNTLMIQEQGDTSKLKGTTFKAN